MKLTLTTLILTAMSIMNVHAVTKTITTKDFIVHYEDYTEKYAKASLKILNIAKANAVKLGFTLPKQIEFDIVKADKNRLSASRSGKLITYEFKSINDFLSPEKSG